MELTKLEYEFFNTLDTFCRLKLGINEEFKNTDSGARFINDCFDVLCNVMSADPDCFHKLCAFYKSVNASLPDGVGVSGDDTLVVKHACERVFNNNMS